MNKDKSYFDSEPSSYWIASTEDTHYPRLDADLDVDVAIVGGGMTGIMTAYFLQEAGMKTAIIDSDQIAKGTSGHTTAKITSQHGLIYDKVIGDLGMEMAEIYAKSNEWAISFIENLVSDLEIECDFEKKNAYVYTFDQDYVSPLQKEVEAASKLGIKASFERQIDLPFQTYGALKFENQAQFHPRKYLLSLAKHITDKGGLLFENTVVVDIDGKKNPSLVTRDSKRIRAKKLVIACHYPFVNEIGFYFARLVQERSYIVGLKVKEDLANDMYITAENPTRSIRAQAYEGGKLLLVGGEHHKTGHGEDEKQHYINLLNFAKEHYTVEDVPFRWSAQDLTSPDDIPFIGNISSFSENIYIGTAYKKWGMTTSHIAAKIISDLILKGSSQWEKLYSPSRPLQSNSILKLLGMNLHVAKDLISGKLKTLPSDFDNPMGEARITRLEGETLGCYRNEDGTLYFVDTTCTHLGCELKWNSGEKSWDCPCHGSRFDYKGNIINGPALVDLDCRVKED